MTKRKYTHIQELLPVIQAMIANGKSHAEIEKHLGLTGDRPVHNLLKRERRGEKKRVEGQEVKAKGRPRKDGQPPHQNPQKEIDRLRMENKLLRDFLSLTERK
mgnify:CR=1 FL=1